MAEAVDFELLQELNLFIYSFRYVPADLTGELDDPDRRAAVNEYGDWLNQRVTDDPRLTGEAYVTTTEIDGHTAIRLSICSHRTTLSDIDAMFDALRRHGERLDDEHRERFEQRDPDG